MENITTILIVFITVGLVFSSGCIDNTKANNTWGEKKISLDAIKISDNTTGNHSEGNESIYYVYGYIDNNNPYEALNIKMNVTTYTSNGTVFAFNDTPYLELNNIPANGEIYFYAGFSDPNKKIAKYEVKILDAKAEYWT
ncbi:MAG: hypothetical protein B655_0782 [Methanobacterium sp. Maddingley MBC34]|nr:MAG: hypothetical protein B655_0782 [Methanobacterium sp. Maddingley MBC34]